jgi:aminocarboxymuconate-semialdehyde decarboxylase
VRIIDFHAHWTPECYRQGVAACGTWHQLGPETGELDNSGFTMTLDERIADMDALGVDVQVISPCDGFYQYDNDLDITVAVARDCNEEIAQIAADHPERFMGLGTLPLQDTEATLVALRQGMADGLKGFMIGDHVNGENYDEERFAPFWAEAEALGALIFFHQGLQYRTSIPKYFLQNSIGNQVERAMTFGHLVGGGVLDRFPSLKLLLGHGGGFVPYLPPRMDKAWGHFSEDQPTADGYHAAFKAKPFPTSGAAKPAEEYLRSFYFDCCTYSGALLRFLIDNVGADRVVFGTDVPAPMLLTNGVRWIEGLDVLSDVEKQMILRANGERLLDGDTDRQSASVA